MKSQQKESQSICSQQTSQIVLTTRDIKIIVINKRKKKHVVIDIHTNHKLLTNDSRSQIRNKSTTFSFMYNIMIPLVSFLAALRILTHAQTCNNGVGKLVYEKVSDYGLSGLQLYPTNSPAQLNSNNNNNNRSGNGVVVHKIENLTRTDAPVRVLEECLKRCQEDRTTLISRCLSFDFIPGQRRSTLFKAAPTTTTTSSQSPSAANGNDTTSLASMARQMEIVSQSGRQSSKISLTNITGINNEQPNNDFQQLSAEYEPSKCIFYNERAAPDGEETLIRRNKEWHFNEICLSSSKVVSQCQNRLYVFERIPGFRLDSSPSSTSSTSSSSEQKEVVANNRSECQDKCLNEYRFPCRAATYDRKNKRCILSRQTRHMNLLGFKPDPNCDYLENGCLTRQQMCHSSALIMETNKELNSIYERDLLHVQTFQQCYEQCQMSLEMRGFLCRSFMYDEMAQTCLIYDEDPFQVMDMNSALLVNNTTAASDLMIGPNQGQPMMIASSSSSNNNNMTQQQKYMSVMSQYYFDQQTPATTSSSNPMTPMHATVRSMRPSSGNLYRIICINSETAKNYITNATIQCFHNKRFNGQHQVEIAAQNFYDCLQECLVRFNHNCKSIEFSTKKKLCKFSVFAARQLTSKTNNLVSDADYDYYKFVWHRSSSSPSTNSPKANALITNRIGLGNQESNTLDNTIGSNYGQASSSISYISPQQQQQQHQQQGTPASSGSSNQSVMQSESNLHTVNAALGTKTAPSSQMTYSSASGSATMNFIPRPPALNDVIQTYQTMHDSNLQKPPAAPIAAIATATSGYNSPPSLQNRYYSTGGGGVASNKLDNNSNNNNNLFTVYGQTSKSAQATAHPLYTAGGGSSNGATNSQSSYSSFVSSSPQVRGATPTSRYQINGLAPAMTSTTKTATTTTNQQQQDHSNESSLYHQIDSNSAWSNNQHIRTSNPPSSSYTKTVSQPTIGSQQQAVHKPATLNQYSPSNAQQDIYNDISMVPNQFVNLPHGPAATTNTEKPSGYSYLPDNSVSPYTYIPGHSSSITQQQQQQQQHQTQLSATNDLVNAQPGSMDINNIENSSRQQQQSNNNGYNLRYGVLRSPHSSSAFNQMEQSASAQDQQQQQISYDRPLGQTLPTASLNGHHHNRIQFAPISQLHNNQQQHPKIDSKSIVNGDNSGGYTTTGGTGYSIGVGSSGSSSTNNNLAYSPTGSMPSSNSIPLHYSPNNVQSSQPQPASNQQSTSILAPNSAIGAPSNPCKPGFTSGGSSSLSLSSSSSSTLDSASSTNFPSNSNVNAAQQEPLYSTGVQVVTNDINQQAGGGAGGGVNNVKFNRIGFGTRLRSQYIFKVIRANTLTDCERACAMASPSSSNPDYCRSFNYRGFFDAENCELSRRDSRHLKLDSPLHFEQHTQFDYYERDTTQQQQQQVSASASSLSAAYLNAPAMMAVDCLEVTQSCTPDGMEFTLRTQEPFNGRIYTYGFYDSCFFDGESSTTSVLRISRTNGFPRCGTQQLGDLMTNIVVVQFNDFVQTTRDKKYNLTCYFSGYGEAVVTSNYLDTKIDGRSHPMQIEHLPSQNVITSNVVLRVLYRGQPTTTIVVGDLLTFRLEARSQYRYDLLNNEIFATNVIAKDPYTGHQYPLIDSRGCPLDPYLFPELQKTPDGALESEFYAFRLQDSNFLIFQATVRTCKSPCEPILCTDTNKNTQNKNPGNSVPSWGRRRRRRDTLDEEVIVTKSDDNKISPSDIMDNGSIERELEPSETFELHSFTIPARLKHSSFNELNTISDVQASKNANMPPYTASSSDENVKLTEDLAEEEVKEMFRVYASRDEFMQAPKSPKSSAQFRNVSSNLRSSSLDNDHDMFSKHLHYHHQQPISEQSIQEQSNKVCLSEFGYYSMVASIVSLTLMVGSVIFVATYVMRKSKFAIKQVADDRASPVSMTRVQTTTSRNPVSSYMMYGCLILVLI